MDDHVSRLEVTVGIRQLSDNEFDPLFWTPERRGLDSAWWGHVPFAHWLVSALRPRILVELGTHHGVSYAAFCQAVLRCRLSTRAFAVDTWQGDAHASMYDDSVYQDFSTFHNERYAAFSTLLRCTFDEALHRIDDGSIDLLHIDGFHSYEAVQHDFSSWTPKLSERAVALFHDIDVHLEGFGVWRFWRELRESHPHFEFHHSHGLGLVAFGKEVPPAVAQLCAINATAEGAALRSRIALIGERWIGDYRERKLKTELHLAKQAFSSEEAGRAKAEDACGQLHAEAEVARAALEAARREAEARHTALTANLTATEAVRSRLELQLAQLRRTRTEMEAAHRKTVESLEAGRRKTVEEMEAAHRRTVDQMEAGHRRAVQQLQARLGAAHAEIAARGKRREKIETAARLQATAFQELENYARNLEQLNAALQQEQQQLQVSARRFSEIEASTTWRATAVLRRAGARLPRPIRRSLRRSAKAMYWLLTPHRLPRRIRFLRERGRLPPVASTRTNAELSDNSASSGTPEPSAASHESANASTAPLATMVTSEPSTAGDDSDKAPTVPLATVVTEALHLTGSDREIDDPEPDMKDSVTSDREPITHLDRKSQFASDARAQFEAFVASGHRLSLPTSEDPEISILLVLYNQAPLSYLCLRSVIETADVPIETIIVDNASQDETSQLLDRVDGARIVRNESNLHFLHGVNQAAAFARGRAILLLNSDAELTPGALTAAHETLFSAADVGAVGGKLILPDGTLQEAGSVVWADGSCRGYGRGWSADVPECQFRRDVDYCSGAFLLIRRDVFERLGRLDVAFAPAYYEETDLCMRLQEIGFRVVYEPRAAIRHFEFGSSSESGHAIELMRRHQTLFYDRHARALKQKPSAGSSLLFARHTAVQPRILVIDDRVPFPFQGSGSPRAAHMLQQLKAAGFFITFYPFGEPHADWREVYDHHPSEIEFMLGHGPTRFGEFLEQRAGYYDFILISRPHNMVHFANEYNAHPGRYRGVGIIYDAEAVFAAREALRLELAGVPLPRAEAERRLMSELELGRLADAIITVTEKEAGLFRAVDIANVHVLGHGMTVEPTAPGFDERFDFLLVGAMAGDDSPNVDGLLWFAREVMPDLDARLGDTYVVRVVGAASAPSLRAFDHPRVEFLGRVDDLTTEYSRSRVFIAPTRFAAGLPHKVHEAAARGVPVVATGLLVSQLGWADREEILGGDTPEQFAEQCARLYTDAALWWRLRERALKRVADDCNPAAFSASLAAVFDSVVNKPSGSPYCAGMESLESIMATLRDKAELAT